VKPAPFRFEAPASREAALDALAQHGDAGRVLAGGQSLVPLMNMRMVAPAVLVSINGCRDLDYIREENGALVLGALVRQAAAEESALVREKCPLLAAALPWIGGAANRNRGTVCGSLAHADPLAELPAVALALEAELVIASKRGRRTVPARAFFVAELTNCMASGEMLEAVRFPVAGLGERSAFLEVANRSHAFAVAGAAAQIVLGSNGRCIRARIAVIGGGPTARRIAKAEAALEGRTLDEAAASDAAAAVRDGVEPIADIHADAAYRRHVLGVLVARAVRAAANGGTPA
jgi:carbon-monoxide dehydrogenase medium subunit